MNIIIYILISVILSFGLLAYLFISEAIKRKNYVERKENDQRLFNQIRDKKWWK